MRYVESLLVESCDTIKYVCCVMRYVESLLVQSCDTIKYDAV